MQKTRSQNQFSNKQAVSPVRLILLDISREGNFLKVSADELQKGESGTIRHYEEIPVSMEMINARCSELVETLNKANRRGRIPSEFLSRLREIGNLFYDELLPYNVKEKLKNTNSEYLQLSLDEQLVHIPWELFYDGNQFLCRRFRIGRLVNTRQFIPGVQTRATVSPMNLMIIADPERNLSGAYIEAKNVRDYLDQNYESVYTTMHSSDISTESVREKLKNFDIVHFAGHADYNVQNPAESGWQLSNGILKAGDIVKMAGGGVMPSLIFSNACQSARTEQWKISDNFENEISGLANAFLLAGVRHYLGTFWEILDEPGSCFALAFYKNLFSGRTVGESVQEARDELISKYGENTIYWASYVLYGDPSHSYTDHMELIQPLKRTADDRPMRIESETRSPEWASEEVIDFSNPSGIHKRNKNRKKLTVIGGITILAAILILAFTILFSGINPEEYEQQANSAFLSGDYEKASKMCQLLQQKYPDRSMSFIILGKISFFNGDMKAAEKYFEKAVTAKQASDDDKAEAKIGLGRIASIADNTDEALSLYRQAAELAPQKTAGYISQAMLLDSKKKTMQASRIIEDARMIAPADPNLDFIATQFRNKVASASSNSKQERIDHLVKELDSSLKNGTAPEPSDRWTSRPLTIWLMDLESVGYSLQEGKDQLLVSAITGHLIENSRIRFVERSLLDKLLEELKIGASSLSEKGLALSIGRLLAARVIITGKVVHSGLNSQILLRLIETETSQVVGSISETFGQSESTATMAELLSQKMIKLLMEAFPVKGKINRVQEDRMTINIGQQIGLKPGDRVKTVEKDEVVIEINDVKPGYSSGRIIKGNSGSIEAGDRVEGI